VVRYGPVVTCTLRTEGFVADPRSRGSGRLSDVTADIVHMRRRLPTLEAVERRRSQLWTVAGLFLLAASATVLLLIAAPDAVETIPDNPAIRLGFVALSVAFLLYVFDQERRMRRLSAALVNERVLSSALESRVRDLATLSRVGQVVNSVLTTEEVLTIILDGAFELTSAVTGSVMLAADADLVVAVSAGAAPAPVGSRQSLDSGVAGRVATTREPLLINGRVGVGQIRERRDRERSPSSSIVAPMIVGDELVGTLAIERSPESPEFTEWELRAVALFASHAATAVMNARRYESERSNVERLADMLERRSEFVATLVHDLKAPLSSIIGFTKLLHARADTMGPDRREQSFSQLNKSADQMLRMVDDILRGASVEATVTVRPEDIDAVKFAEELADVTRSVARGRDEIERDVTVHGEPGITIQADRGALRSVLLNLLENAVKYSPPGAPIDVTVAQTDQEVMFSVRDRGKGIAEDARHVIFERFRQREDGESIAGGVGLGLYIVRSLVLAQGGRIWVESELGKGSTFNVALPRRGVWSAAAAVAPESEIAGT